MSEQDLSSGGSPSVDVNLELPDRDFTCRPALEHGRLAYADSVVRGRFLRFEEGFVLATTPLATVDFGALHAYMHRRFGPPFRPGDPDKDITAGWVLTTPDAGVFLKVSPSLAGPEFSLIPMLPLEAGKVAPDDVSQARQDEIVAAYRGAVMDLLRPVPVRDQAFNAMGIVKDDDPLNAWTEWASPGGERPVYQVEPDRSCGYAMPSGLMGSEGWGDLVSVLARFGNGDMAEGSKAAVAVLRMAMMHDLASKPVEVRILLAARALTQAEPGLLEALCLDPKDRALAESISPALSYGSGYGDIPDYGIAAEEGAEALADAFGIRGRIIDPLRQARWNLGIEKEHRLMWEAAGDDEIPDEVLPKIPEEMMGITGPQDVDTFVANLHAFAPPAVAAWANRLGAEEGGRDILFRILDHMIETYQPPEKNDDSAPAP